MTSQRTLFQVLVEQRGWSEYQVFKNRFARAAQDLARSEGPASLRTVTIEHRQFVRYLNGETRNPQTVTRRVLEHLFPGVTADRLMRPADQTAAPSGASEYPNGIEDAAMAAAEESARFAAHAESSNVGPHTLEQLEADIRRVINAYPNQPIESLFGEVRGLRDRSFELLEGRQPPAYTRDLYLAAGVLCGVLANACFDLGNYAAADTQSRTAFLCGELAGHNGIRSWVRGMQALTAYWDGRPIEAARLAADGAQYVPESGTAQVRAHSIRARAHAQAGDANQAHAALQAADSARETVVDDGFLTGMLAFPREKQLFYAASTHLWLHGNENLAAVEENAVAALDLYESAPREHRRLGEMSLARVDLASARLGRDDLDGAGEALGDVVAASAKRQTESVNRRVAQFGRDLSVHPAHDSRAGIAMRDLVAANNERRARNAIGPV
jgi:hypothetical protein